MKSEQLQSYYDRFAADPAGYESEFFNALKYHIEARVRSLPSSEREDAAQEISLIVWRAIHTSGSIQRFSSWLNTIIRNWCTNYVNSLAGKDEAMTLTFTDLETMSQDDDGITEMVSFDPTATCPPLPPVDYTVLAVLPDWLTGTDLELAKLVLAGYSLDECSGILSTKYDAVQKRFVRLLNKCRQDVRK
jgi:hypothetical protein